MLLCSPGKATPQKSGLKRSQSKATLGIVGVDAAAGVRSLESFQQQARNPADPGARVKRLVRRFGSGAGVSSGIFLSA